MITIGILFFNENEQEILRIFRALKRQIDQNFSLILTVEPRSNGIRNFEIFNEFRNVKIIENKINRGTVSNRNIIVSECKTEYLAFIDGDDFVDRNFVKVINNSILSNADLYFYNYFLVNNNSKTLVTFENLDIISESLRDWKIIGCSVYRVEIFRNIGCYIDNGFEDVEIMLRMISNGFSNFQFVPQTNYYWIKKQTGRNSNVKSLDHAYLMQKYLDLFFRNNSKDIFLSQYTNVFNIFYSQRKYLSAVKIALRGRLMRSIFIRINNKLFKK
jgi:glycosyltransferase involved in cell wall biosynthesis